MIFKNVDFDTGTGVFAKRRARLIFNEDFYWTNCEGKTWRIEKGSSSDGHSSPSFFRGAFPSLDESLMAAICHDIDCINASKYKLRREGDKDYLINMKQLGVPWWSRRLKYWGVSLMSVWLKVRGKV